MIGSQPASRAPWTELRPTPPQPITTTLDPALTLAVLTTAPMPVSTPQAISDALSSFRSFGITTACEASTTMCSAKAPVRRPWTIGLPSPSLSGRRLVEREHLFAEHRRALGAGRAEAAVADEGRDHVVAGARAGSRRARPLRRRRPPRGRRRPAVRRPRRRPCRRCRCGRSRRRPIRIRTSPGPGGRSSIVSMDSGAPKARQTAALVFMRSPK